MNPSGGEPRAYGWCLSRQHMPERKPYIELPARSLRPVLEPRDSSGRSVRFALNYSALRKFIAIMRLFEKTASGLMGTRQWR
jgi:hypothetical protein